MSNRKIIIRYMDWVPYGNTVLRGEKEVHLDVEVDELGRGTIKTSVECLGDFIMTAKRLGLDIELI